MLRSDIDGSDKDGEDDEEEKEYDERQNRFCEHLTDPSLPLSVSLLNVTVCVPLVGCIEETAENKGVAGNYKRRIEYLSRTQ